MADPADNHGPLLHRVASRRRHRLEAAAGEHSFFRSLGIIGGLGWMIVLPMLGGLAAGRWLDGFMGGGIMWTGALLVIGLVIGCRLAWRRIHHP